MSLSQKIAAALDARPDIGVLPCDLSVEDGAHRLTVHLTAAGPVGLAFSRVEFAATEGQSTPEALRAWGDRLASRLTYLMEPLVVLEHDPVGGEVELRSQSPTAKAGHRSYYEVRLNPPRSLTLSRYSFDEAARIERLLQQERVRRDLEKEEDDEDEDS